MGTPKTRSREVEEYLKANCKDKTVSELAESINRQRRTVATWLKELGLEAKKYKAKRKLKIKEDQIKFLWENWFEPLTLLAEGIGVKSKKTVRAHLNDLGIERPSGKQENEKLRALMYRLRNYGNAEPEWWHLQPTREDALKLNEDYYWDGQPCASANHISKRRTINSSCYYCEQEKIKERLLEKESRDKAVLKLRKEGNFTYGKISKMLGIGRNTVASIIKAKAPDVSFKRSKTTEEHKKELIQNQIEYILIGKYNGRKVHSSYYCKKHNKTYDSSADKILNGQALKCCYEENRGKAKIARHASIYDDELAEHGIVVRAENYIGTHKRIWHFCLVHLKFHQGTPAHLKMGGGLECCRNASTKSTSDRQNDEARENFSKRLSSISPNYEWVDLPYINTRTKVKIYCKKHKETHPLEPSKLLQGRQIPCCTYEGRSLSGKKMAEINRSTADSVWRALLDKLETKGSVYLYLYKSPDGNYNKFGISAYPKKRANSGGYGDQLIQPRFYAERSDGVLIEQAYKYGYSCEPPESLRSWEGHTELTTNTPEQFLEIINELEEALLHFGTWEFAENYCDPFQIKWALHEMKPDIIQ